MWNPVNNLKVGSWASSLTLIVLLCALTFKGTNPEGRDAAEKVEHEETSSLPAPKEETCHKPKPEGYFNLQDTQTPLAASPAPTCDTMQCTMTGAQCPTSNTCLVKEGSLLCPAVTVPSTCCGACTKNGTNVCCSTLGQSCTSDTQCCDFSNVICPNKKCCLIYGHAGKCGSHGDCCNGICRGLQCCGNVGAACDFQSDCCDQNTQACQNTTDSNGMTQKTCCVLAGKQCSTFDQGCCGGSADCKAGSSNPDCSFCCLKQGASCGATVAAACCNSCSSSNNTCI